MISGMMITVDETVAVALEVIADKYGVDPERREKLKAAGYDADKVQRCVNDIIALCNKYT